jgi:hypothetical protein
MLETLTRTGAKAEAATEEPAPDARRRIILLSGEWRMPGCVLHLEATIFASDDGAAQGDIFWTNVDTPKAPADLACTELVRGTAGGMSLDLQGYKIDRPLVRERYRIMLVGEAHAGVFEGASSLHAGVWDGKLSGAYQVVEEKA